MAVWGCAPEGAGTVEVGKAADVRSRLPGGGAAPSKGLSAKQVKALEAQEKEPAKIPKLD
jgi:hypothetical protein